MPKRIISIITSFAMIGCMLAVVPVSAAAAGTTVVATVGTEGQETPLVDSLLVDSSAGSITNVEAKLDETSQTVKVKGTINLGIGKEVTIIVTDPQGNLDYIDQATSGDGGAFAFTYSPTAILDGNYVVKIGGEEVAVPYSLNLQLTSPQEEVPTATLTGPVSVISGQSVDLTVGVGNVKTYQNTFAQDVTVTYDPSQLQYVSAKSVKTGVEIVDQKAASGQIRFILANVGSNHGAEGDWLTLTFLAKATQSTSTSVEVSKMVIADNTGVETQEKDTSHSLQITAVDTTALSALITTAQTQHDAAVEGTAAGQYVPGSKAALQAVIDSAKDVLANSAATQADVAQAVSTLTAALQTFANSISADKTALSALIANAQSKHDSAVEGTHPGQYPDGSKAVLQSAIDSANEVLANTAAKQADVDQAVATLTEALNTFINSVVERTSGDINGDSTISVGDLAIVAAAYGKTKEDADWDKYKVADVNGDGVVDILDLAAVAHTILQK